MNNMNIYNIYDYIYTFKGFENTHELIRGVNAFYDHLHIDYIYYNRIG